MSMSQQQIEKMQNKLQKAITEFKNEAKLFSKDIVVIGCSTSEILGEMIGKASNLSLAQKLQPIIRDTLMKDDIFLAYQCCEHLNRSLVVSKECSQEYSLKEVTVKPVPDAGGAMATAAYEDFENPVVVEEITAQGGIDIGDTFIGMHLDNVAVPVRTGITSLGSAHLTFARTRPKLVGGERATYPN